MSFSRAKPAGWTASIDTITAAQINQIDINQSRALDGTNGGTYTLAAPLTLNDDNVTIEDLIVSGSLDAQGGASFDSFGPATVSNPVTYSGSTGWSVWRVGVISDTASVQTITPNTADIWVIPELASNNLDIRLSTSSAVNGMIVHFQRNDGAAGARTCLIRTTTPTTIATFGTGVTDKGGVSFFYYSTTWRVLHHWGAVTIA